MVPSQAPKLVSCTNCRVSKRHCDKVFPCSRYACEVCHPDVFSLELVVVVVAVTHQIIPLKPRIKKSAAALFTALLSDAATCASPASRSLEGEGGPRVQAVGAIDHAKTIYHYPPPHRLQRRRWPRRCKPSSPAATRRCHVRMRTLASVPAPPCYPSRTGNGHRLIPFSLSWCLVHFSSRTGSGGPRRHPWTASTRAW